LRDSHLARLVIALRTADYADLMPQMLKTMDEANNHNPHYAGWAWHSYRDTLPGL
jgi:hypothetical protein